MEFLVGPVTVPAKISFNYAELKAELTAKVEDYKTIVYTDDTIKDAKTDRANLNKLKKTMNDERLRIQREYMVPIDEFKAQVDDLIGIVGEAAACVDKQIKDYDAGVLRKKKLDIQALFLQTGFQPWIKLEMIWNPKWENKTYSLKDIEQELKSTMYRITDELFSLDKLEFAFEAKEEYKRTLDISKAISEGQRLADMQKRKQEAEERRRAEVEAKRQAEERAKAEQTKNVTPEPVKSAETAPVNAEQKIEHVDFRAYGTREQLLALAQYMKMNGIKFGKVE